MSIIIFIVLVIASVALLLGIITLLHVILKNNKVKPESSLIVITNPLEIKQEDFVKVVP
jgi:hypothetical protein